MKQPVSIFNDVLGPAMIGPSSSHTAASVRVGRLIRDLCHGRPAVVEFVFSVHGSLASTYHAQGADIGLAAGLLGLETNDMQIACALDLAREQGVEIRFLTTEETLPHPNTYLIRAKDACGHQVSAEMASTGGGMIEVSRIQGFPVDMDGGYFEMLLISPADREACSHLLQPHAEDLRFLEDGSRCMLECKSRAPIPAELLSALDCAERYVLQPVLPVLSRRQYPHLPDTAGEIFRICTEENLSLAEMALRYETARSGADTDYIYRIAADYLSVIRLSLSELEANPPSFEGCILGMQSTAVPGLFGGVHDLSAKIIFYITRLMEAKTAMLPIIAAPTAGSCGLLFGTLLALQDVLSLSDRQICDALLSAGMVGVVIGTHATFAGEVGGCQAECGSASGMAAAAVVSALGGSAGQCLDAAAMALQNSYGMTCDPIANRVEVPCLGKNIMGAFNAYAMALCSMSGYDKVISLDETIQEMYHVGQLLPACLRCTGKAGLAQTPGALQLERTLP